MAKAKSARRVCYTLLQTFYARQIEGSTQCPADMIDQIGGWSSAGIGQSYGEGYNVKALFYNMKDI